MKIKILYNESKNININSYLSLCGVKNADSYIKGMTVEPTIHYDNIDEFVTGMRWCLNSTDRLYLLVDS